MKKTIATILAATLLIGAILTLTACGKKGIVGTWKGSTGPISGGSYDGKSFESFTTYNADGTGTYEVPDLYGLSRSFAYRTDGNTLYTQDKGDTEWLVSTFSVSGDTLTITNRFGQTFLLSRVK